MLHYRAPAARSLGGAGGGSWSCSHSLHHAAMRRCLSRCRRLTRLVGPPTPQPPCLHAASMSTSSPTSSARPKKVVVTSKAFPETLAMLREASLQVVANSGEEPWTPEELAGHCVDADAMMCFMPDKVDRDFLERCPNLKIIGCALKGFDNFDVAAASERGIWVTYVPGLLTEPTAELAVGMIIAANRKVRAGDELVRSGTFNGWRPVLYGRGLHNATVGIWGFGAVGQAVATQLSGFGCAAVLTHDIVARPEIAAKLGCRESSFEEVMSCDVVVTATPLNQSTRHGIDKHVIAEHMSQQTLLCNISRGSVVCEQAVAEALHAGTLGAYAADVFEFEDWALHDRPLNISPELLAAPNTLFTPHLGSAVIEVRQAIEQSAATTIVEWAHGVSPPSNALNSV